MRTRRRLPAIGGVGLGEEEEDLWLGPPIIEKGCGTEMQIRREGGDPQIFKKGDRSEVWM